MSLNLILESSKWYMMYWFLNGIAVENSFQLRRTCEFLSTQQHFFSVYKLILHQSDALNSLELNFTRKAKWPPELQEFEWLFTAVEWILHSESPREYFHSKFKNETDVFHCHWSISNLLKNSLIRSQDLLQAWLKHSLLRFRIAVFSFSLERKYRYFSLQET